MTEPSPIGMNVEKKALVEVEEQVKCRAGMRDGIVERSQRVRK